LKKINIVRKNIEFNNIINVGIKYHSDLFFVYLLKNSYDYNRYGIAISKKIGNAVVRNKYKRQVKDIIDDIKVSLLGYDFIFIARPKIKLCSYEIIKNNIVTIFSKIGEKYEK